MSTLTGTAGATGLSRRRRSVVLEGGGAVVTDEGETPLQAGCAVLVLPDEVHSSRSGEEGAGVPMPVVAEGWHGGR